MVGVWLLVVGLCGVEYVLGMFDRNEVVEFGGIGIVNGVFGLVVGNMGTFNVGCCGQNGMVKGVGLGVCN